MTIGNPAFCLLLCLTGVYFPGELQHVGDVNEQNFKSRPIKTREIGGVRLSEELYDNYKLLIMFQQIDVYLNEPIKTDELIKLANQ